MKETTKPEVKEDFDIPTGPSWGVRILIGLAVLIIVAVVGLGVYMYQQPSGFFSRFAPKVAETVQKKSKSVAATTEADINTTAKKVIDEVDTAPKVSDNYEPISATTKFLPDTDTIYLTLQTTNLTEAKQLKAEWYYVDDDTFIDEAVYGAEKGVNNIAFHLQQPPSGSWPKGKYEVKIYVDGALAQIAQFQVVDAAQQDANEKTL